MATNVGLPFTSAEAAWPSHQQNSEKEITRLTAEILEALTLSNEDKADSTEASDPAKTYMHD